MSGAQRISSPRHKAEAILAESKRHTAEQRALREAMYKRLGKKPPKARKGQA